MDVDGGVGGEDHTGAARSDVHLQPVVGLRVRFPAAFRCGSPPPARRSPAKIAAKYAPYTNFDGTLDGFRRNSAGIPPEVSGAGRALPFRGNGFRRDHQVRDLQRRHRGDRKSNAGAAFLDPRAPDGIDRRGPCRAAIAWIREFAGGRHTGADRRKAVGAQGGRTVLRHHLFPGGGLRHVRHRIVEGGVVVEGALFEKEVIPALQ